MEPYATTSRWSVDEVVGEREGSTH
jgi:hypothetical protein